MLAQALKFAAAIFRPIHNTDWEVYETAEGPVMRRRMNGEYQTRQMTEDEFRDYAKTRQRAG
jgi:hypothetical protein